MSLPYLTIIPAGAGSGKTYTLQKKLYEWISSGMVRADRIIAVTFTEAAAGELRGRIGQELIENGRLQDALKLDQSYISTIHGFGLRLMMELAFDAGLSPQPRMLTEDEESIFIRRNLSAVGRENGVIRNLKKFGYDYSFTNRQGAEEQFRKHILQVVNTLRSIGCQESNPQLLSRSVEKITSDYGATVNAEKLKNDLHAAVQQAASAFPNGAHATVIQALKSCLSTTFTGINNKLLEQLANICIEEKFTAKKITEKIKDTPRLQISGLDTWLKTDEAKNFKKDLSPAAIKEFKEAAAAVNRAAKTSALDTDWHLWQKLRKLRKSKSFPEYTNLIQDVMDAADKLPTHPGPLQDALVHIETLLKTAQDILGKYAVQKHNSGLVDFTDMLALTSKLLVDNKEVVQELEGRIDCLVIDEFQDTNPLQFSLLWTLHNAGIPCLIVGDLKQAIMRFQNADSRLMVSIQEHFSGNVQPLTSNWRSTKQLMNIINRFGKGLFGDGYDELKPMASFTSTLSSLDILCLKKGCGRKYSEKAQHMALHLASLLNDDTQQVWDKKKMQHRPLKAKDIAVLCYTHRDLYTYSAALRAVGLKTRLSRPGWFESESIQLCYYALSYLADQADRHAALYLAVSAPGTLTLEQAITQLFDSGTIKEPLLHLLDAIREQVQDVTVSGIVNRMFQKLKFFEIIALWPDADQQRANLIRLQGEAQAFDEANWNSLAAGGFYGRDIKTFLAWLKKRIVRENNLPNPRVVEEHAVELITWHASKGREWPIIAVCRLDKKYEPRLPGMEVSYDSFENLETILDSANLDLYPKYQAPESNEPLLQQLEPEAEKDALNILYVALTRAREKIILECSVIQDRKVKSYWNLLQGKTSFKLEKNNSAVSITGEKFPCTVIEADTVAEVLEQDNVSANIDHLLTLGRRALDRSAVMQPFVPASISPSMLHGGRGQEISLTWEHQTYHTPLDCRLEESAVRRGIILHRCFELLAQDTDSPASTLQRGLDVSLSEQQLAGIIQQGEAFYGYLQDNFSWKSIQVEVPILFKNDSKSVVSGSIDLLLEAEAGYWIVDHKTNMVDDIDSHAKRYQGQLLCYRDAVDKAAPCSRSVQGLLIHWISRGMVSVCHLA